ncbi:MAG: B12-binding domain-containing radical SAM protein [Candidatus Marinimicrobia bacterium]|nr:B12-binding domain-containing radical SAM protein [Candidatus Neomarinimicrobiota bacterium]
MLIDILFINPGDRKKIFQGLGTELTAIEPPFQIASYAAYLRNEGFTVSIIDANAENISPVETAQKVKSINPLIVAVIVYGNQPSASTQNMDISYKIVSEIKEQSDSSVIISGLHASALPEQTLLESDADFVIEGEEQIPLYSLIESFKKGDGISDVPGIWYKNHLGKVYHNDKPPLISDLDKYLPIAAWDLLPMDLYRAHNWHCFNDIESRSPYGAIYTSLGCPYKCNFCCINAQFGVNKIRYRSPELIVDELELLNKKYNIKNIKIIDEMFVLNKKHYMTIVDLIIKKKLDLNIWAYARIDTIKEDVLKKMKNAGFNWLGIGIESGSSEVRDGAVKQLKNNDVKNIVSLIEKFDIEVGANYIFGLQDETQESMQSTLDLAKVLNTAWANFYCAMAYPGSPLYSQSVNNKVRLPEKWGDYSQHSYGTLPLPSNLVSAKEILKFRDNAFHEYFESERYLNMMFSKFGSDAVEHIKEMTKTKLNRKLLEGGVN